MAVQSAVDADAESVKRIGKTLMQLSNEMQVLCKDIRRDVEGASQSMQDASGKDGCAKIMQNVEVINGLLKSIEDFGDRCYSEIAPAIVEAQSYRI